MDHILGEWAVSEGGQTIGNARFRKAAHNCAIVHDFQGTDAKEGKGLLYFDTKWRSILITPNGVQEDEEVQIASTAGAFKYQNRSYSRAGYPTAGPHKELCTKPEHQIFKFWEGKWDVFTPHGVQSGTNHVYEAANGCALIENWTAANLTTGISINFWDPGQSHWRQIWVAPGGALRLAGKWYGGALRLLYPGQTRLSFTPNLDGSVRQFWEQSNDQGKTWIVAFDGTYRRAKQRTAADLAADLNRTAADVERRVNPADLPALIAAEKFFQSRAAGPPGDNGLDPGAIEPFLPTVLFRWKPPTSTTGTMAGFRAARAQTVAMVNAEGGRSMFPGVEANLDSRQWLTLAAEYSRKILPSAIRSWKGQWRGEGTFQGKAARIDVTLKPILDDTFDELTITVTPATGAPFLGRAVYDASGSTAYWHDSMSNAYAIKAEWDGEKLVALWADPVRGRSTYTVNKDGKFQITDEVRRPNGTFVRFAEYTLRPAQ